MPPSGVACCDSPISALDFLSLGFFPPLHGLSWPGSTMLVLALQADPLLSPQSTACLGSPMSVSSCSRLDATTFAFDLSTLDLLMVLRGMCYAGVVMLPCGILNPDSLLPVLDSLSLGALLLLRSFSRMGSFPPIPGCSHSDIPLFLHSLFHPGLSSLLFGSVHLELSLPPVDFSALGASILIRCLSHPDPVFSSRGMGQSDFLPFMSDCAHFGSSLFARASLQPEPSASFIGTCDFGGAVSVLDHSTFDASLPARHPGRLGSMTSLFGVCGLELSFSLLDLALLGFSSLLQSLSHPAASLSLCSELRFGLPPLVPDLVQLGAVAPWLEHSKALMCKSVGAIMCL